MQMLASAWGILSHILAESFLEWCAEKAWTRRGARYRAHGQCAAQAWSRCGARYAGSAAGPGRGGLNVIPQPQTLNPRDLQYRSVPSPNFEPRKTVNRTLAGIPFPSLSKTLLWAGPEDATSGPPEPGPSQETASA